MIGGNDGLVYLFGGATNTVDSTTPVNQTASYNRNTNTWTNINAPLPSYPASIPVGLRFASALLPSGNFLLVYGNRWAVFNPVNRTYPSSGTTPYLYCTGLTESKNGAIGLFYTNTPNQQEFYTFAEGQGWGQMFITLDANSNLLNNGQGTPYPLYEGALANLGNDSGIFTTYRVNDGVLTKTHMLNLGYSPSPIYYIKRTVA